ncbi:hypothetical protein SAMN02910301_0073 [Lachnospiraceae bacterium XBD2001]|nr:hypothetical protein SAMN02910301_0073 [Lachnospiraceae bacterium XBD2001]
MASFGRNVVKTWHRAKAILGSVFLFNDFMDVFEYGKEVCMGK